MSTNSSYSLSTLFGKTRRLVLGLLLSRSEETFYLRQIARLTGVSVGALQRELKALVAAGLITRQYQDRRIDYRVNTGSPMYDGLRQLFAGNRFGISAVPGKASYRTKNNIFVPQDAVEDFCRRNHISRLAFFGSVLRDDFRPDSDIDVLVEFFPEYMPGLLKMEELQAELSAILGDRKVDLRTPSELNPLFRRQVEANSEVRVVQAR
ncbi:DNA polymerase beta domain protein region [Dehalogenimonas lykanthroporepellens BL-DC-9]|jgi:predicted nucleotidyltransferase/DNA-binding transcriptional ArsR family regulator|nr:DNA polymerase beta domain protein region [Dehalogenimonas lykanthroporepellens BL-DC-9]